MPKGKGKKGKKKSKEEKTSFPRTYYTTQIEELENHLRDLENKRDSENFLVQEMEAKLKQEQELSHDIASYLKHMICDKDNDVFNMTEEKNSVFDESKINELNEQLAREHLLQKSELADLDFEKLKKQSVLREMSEISYDKRVLEKKIADHEAQLAADKKMFAENLYDLEKEAIQKRQSNKFAMINRVKELHEEFEELSIDQITILNDDATKKNQHLARHLGIADQLAGDAIQDFKNQKKTYQSAKMEMKTFEDHDETGDVVDGTIMALRKENSQKAKIMQNLVISYREIEDELDRIKENDNSRAVKKELEELQECEGPMYFAKLKAEHEGLLNEIEICTEKKKIASMAEKVYKELGHQIIQDIKTGGLRKKTTKNLLTQKSLVAPEIILEDIISKPSSTVLFRS